MIRHLRTDCLLPREVLIESAHMTATTATERLGISLLRMRLGTALQKHRLLRGLTQAELAEYADLSLKYVGEIERGEANTTLEVLERLGAAVGWSPMETFETMREPLSEGVRILLLDEVQHVLERLRNMSRWLQALDPAIQFKAARHGATLVPTPDGEERPLKGARPSKKTRKPQQRQPERQQEQAQPPPEGEGG
jgi:transcriptional regulator with XRE-family HTH domain